MVGFAGTEWHMLPTRAQISREPSSAGCQQRGVNVSGPSPISQMGRPKPAPWMGLCWVLEIERRGRKTVLSGACDAGVPPIPPPFLVAVLKRRPRRAFKREN